MVRRGRALKGPTRSKAVAPIDEAELPPDVLEVIGQLREEIFLLETLMDNVPDAIYFKDRQSRFTRVNRHAAAGYGIGSPAEAVGRTDADYFTDEHAAKALHDEQEIIRTGKPLVNVEEKETLPEGEVRWVSTTKLPLRDRGGHIVGTFGISRDITHRKKAEELLRRQAFYDPLTGLPNRALFFDRLQHLFQRGRRALGDSRFALLYLDVDRFKTINDTLGHQAGDEVLIGTVRRIERCLRPADTLARLGGDEFAILLDDIRTDADAPRVAGRIREELATPLVVRGRNILASVSIGIALSSAGYESGEDMLRDADTAMYKAKAQSRLRDGGGSVARRPT
jgi:diguanylate cyclase (GGDEF)-like protein/PAS domain S-box-containing protein